MLLNIKSPHFLQGGTGITNFFPDRVAIYEEAIRRHGDAGYALSAHPMSGNRYTEGRIDSPSLHYVGLPFPRDCGPFWDVFEAVRAEEEKKRAPVNLTLSQEQAKVLMTVCRRVAGVPSGSRGRIAEIITALADSGIECEDHVKASGDIWLEDC
jgi:hypothetical protein